MQKNWEEKMMNKQEKIEELRKENKKHFIKSLSLKLGFGLLAIPLTYLGIWIILQGLVLTSQPLTFLGGLAVVGLPVGSLLTGFLTAGKFDKQIEANEKQINIIKENLFSEEKTEENKIVYQAIKDLADNVSSNGYQPAQENKDLVEDNNSEHGLTN